MTTGFGDHSPTDLSDARRREILSLGRTRDRRKRERMLVEGPIGLQAYLAYEQLRGERVLPRVRYAVASADALDRDGAVRAVWDAITPRLRDEDRLVIDDLRTFHDLAQTQGPQGILAVCDLPRPPAPIGDWVRSTGENGAAIANRVRLLILDRVQDPGNVGTLLRSATAFGVGGVWLRSGSADPFGPKVVRASAGAVFGLPIWAGQSEAEDAETLGQVLATGLPLCVAEMAGADYRASGTWPDAGAMLALGAEVAGLQPDLAAAAAIRVTIPHAAEPQSLNVAMAGTILLAHNHNAAGSDR